jgi:hypothetical protein
MLPSDVADTNLQLIKVVLMLEAIVPSADFVIVACIRGGRTAGAEALAVTYIWECVHARLSCLSTRVAVVCTYLVVDVKRFCFARRV